MASILQKALSFFYFIYLARSLGEVGLGKYTFALSFASIFVIFMDFGLGPILTREGAREKKNLKAYIQTILGTKMVLAVLMLTLMVVGITALYSTGTIPQDTYYLTLLAGFIILLDTFTFTFWSIFRARQQMKWEAIGVFIYQLVIVTSGSIALYLGLPIYYIVGAVLLGSVFHFTYSLTSVKHKTDLSLRPKWDAQLAKKLLKLAAPFALAGIFFKLNGSIDTVMLETLAGEEYVGWYSVAFKLTTALTVLPGAFATSFFPAMSYQFEHSRKELRNIYKQATIYLGFLAIPIAAGSIILAKPIILTVYGPAFAASVMALQIIMVGLVFIFLNYPVGNLLNASNKQTTNTVNMGFALLLNVFLNIWLIPQHTYIGAAISALASSVLLVFLGLPHVAKIIKLPIKDILMNLGKAAGAAGVMTLFIFSFSQSLHLALLVAMGAIIYIAALYLLKGFSIREIKGLVATFTK